MTIHLITLVLSLAGFAGLALATERQQEMLFGQALAAQKTRQWRIAGWCALVAALAVAVTGWGWGLGLVAYSGHTSLAAGLVFLTLVVTERRRTSRGTPRR